MSALHLDVMDPFEARYETAKLLFRQQSYEEAMLIFQEVHEGRRKTLGETDRRTIAALQQIAFIYVAQGKIQQAEHTDRQALASLEATLGVGSRATMSVLYNLSSTLQRQGKHVEAEVMGRKLFPAIESFLGKETPSVLGSRRLMIAILRDTGKSSEAEELWKAGLGITRGMEGEVGRDELEALLELKAK